MFNADTHVLVSWAVPKGLPLRKGYALSPSTSRTTPGSTAPSPDRYRKGSTAAGRCGYSTRASYEMLDREPGKLTFRLEGRSAARHLASHPNRHRSRARSSGSPSSRRISDPRRRRTRHRSPMLATLGNDAFDDRLGASSRSGTGSASSRRAPMRPGWSRATATMSPSPIPSWPDSTTGWWRPVPCSTGRSSPWSTASPRSRRSSTACTSAGSRQMSSGRLDPAPVTFMAFDLLYLDGEDLTARPLAERQGLLDEIVVASTTLQVSPVVAGSGDGAVRGGEGSGPGGRDGEARRFALPPGYAARPTG